MCIYYISMYISICKSIYIHIHMYSKSCISVYIWIFVYLYLYVYVFVCSVAQLCLTLFDPMDYSPQGSLIRGNSQARILEQVAISSSRLSRRRDRTRVSYISCPDRQILHHCVCIHTNTYIKEKDKGNPVICNHMAGLEGIMVVK